MYNLDKLERMEKEATPGEWENCECGNCGTVWSKEQDVLVAVTDPETHNDIPYTEKYVANAAFIAAVRNAAPELFAEIRVLRTALDSIATGEFIIDWQKHPDFNSISAIPPHAQMRDIARRALDGDE